MYPSLLKQGWQWETSCWRKNDFGSVLQQLIWHLCHSLKVNSIMLPLSALIIILPLSFEEIEKFNHTHIQRSLNEFCCKLIETSMSTYFDQKWLRSGLFCSMSTSCNFLPPQDLRLGSCVPLFWAKTCQSCHICFSFDLPFMMINISSQRDMPLSFPI